MTVYDVHGLALAVEEQAGGDDVGRALDARLRGFPHSSAVEPDLTLRYVGDLAAAGIADPAGVSRSVYETVDGDVRHFPAADLLTADLRGVRLHADLAAGVTHIASPSFRGRPRYVAAHPLSTLALLEMLKRRGRFSLHAACLARNGRAVIIAGTAGAGKSTLALGLARAGLDFLGDDMVFLRRTGERVRALGFSDAIGVTENTADWLPELAGLHGCTPTEGFPKHLVRVEDHFDVRVVAEATPVAIVFPQIVGGSESRLEPLDREAAWTRLVPDVLLTEPVATQAHLSTIAALTSQAECHTLLAGNDLDASARLVAELL